MRDIVVKNYGHLRLPGCSIKTYELVSESSPQRVDHAAYNQLYQYLSQGIIYGPIVPPSENGFSVLSIGGDSGLIFDSLNFWGTDINRDVLYSSSLVHGAADWKEMPMPKGWFLECDKEIAMNNKERKIWSAYLDGRIDLKTYQNTYVEGYLFDE